MDRSRTTREVARELTATETAVETALVQAVGLMRRMMDARRELGLPVGVDDPPMRHAIAAVSALGEAQQAVIRTHRDLHALHRALNLPAIDFGPLIKPVENDRGADRRVG